MTDQIRDLESQLAAAATEIEKIDILHILAWELKDRDPQRARLLAQTAHDLARLNDYASGLAHSLKTLGFSNGFAGEYELALAQLLEAKTLFEELDERSGQSTVLWILGAVQWHLGNYGEALEYSLQALQIAEEIGNRPNQAEAINNIAIIYGDRGDQSQAITTYKKALTIFQELDDKRGQAWLLNNMAVDYYQLANHSEALACGLAGLNLVQQTGDRLLEVYLHGTLGEIYLEMGQFEQALDAFQRGLELSKTLGFRRNEQSTLFSIGQVYYRQQDVNLALSFLQQALTLAEATEGKIEIYKCHQLLAEIHESQGNFQQALTHYRRFHEIYQQVFNEEGEKKLKSLEVRYRTDAARKEAGIQHLRNVELEEEVTERKQAEVQARRRADELAALVEVSREILSTLDLSAVLERIASQAKDLLQPVDAVVYLLQPNGHTLQAVVAVGKYADEFREDTVEMGAGIIGHVAQAGIAEMVNKPSLDPRRIHITGSWDKEVGSDDDLYPLMVAPIVVQEKVIGVIAIWRHVETGLFTSANLNFLNALSQQAAIAIQNARLFEAEQYQRQLAEQHSQELETANALLQATNAELDAFAHTVAHDLKNPLGIITSYSDFLFEVGSDMRPDELNLIFGELQKSGYKATNIIEELLLLASVRKGSIKLKPLDMTQIVEGAQRRIRLMIQEYQAEIIHPPNWPQAQGYGPWVEEVWVNYLSNGLKYGGEPPRLELGATPQADGMIRFWVRDNGPGLTPEARTKLFAEFTRLDEVRAEGHGLGLSIVRRIVEKLGGQVGVESEGVPGRGSTFYFTLPAV